MYMPIFNTQRKEIVCSKAALPSVLSPTSVAVGVGTEAELHRVEGRMSYWLVRLVYICVCTYINIYVHEGETRISKACGTKWHGCSI